ncbi:hypothetical protein PRIPAC_91789 [Pristionchus pacificus]|nr:hypothetical protein PRIPAC_91789 [Pristionchus pacificus]
MNSSLLFLLLSISATVALECYVGEVPWGFDLKSPPPYPRDPLNPVPIIPPVLRQCTVAQPCCSYSGETKKGKFHKGRRWECAMNCPMFTKKNQVIELDGKLYCAGPDKACKPK